jgi:Uma2 family endonuclease
MKATARTEPAMTTTLAKVESPPALPPLEPGDRLTRAEFERRYQRMPHLKKAELIEGVVFMPSPVRLKRHGEPHLWLMTWLGTYVAATPGACGGDNVTVRLDNDNELQPDAVLFLDPARGGQARISPDDFLEGAPEWVAEIASSSVSYDLGAKMHVYRRHGVREYVVWRVLDQAVDWFVLHDGEYRHHTATPAGVLCSTVFPGLWLDVPALLRGEPRQVLATLQAGLATTEHRAFADCWPC